MIAAALLLLLTACGGEQEASYRVLPFEEARKYTGGGVLGGGSRDTGISGYAGGELDRETCVWTLYIAGSVAEQAEEIAAFQRRVSGPFTSCPQGYHFRIVEAERSLAELDSIRREKLQGIRPTTIPSWGLDHERNALVLFASTPEEARRLARRLRRRSVPPSVIYVALVPDMPPPYDPNTHFEVYVRAPEGLQPDSATVCVTAPDYRECRRALPGAPAGPEFSVPWRPGEFRIEVRPPLGYRLSVTTPSPRVVSMEGPRPREGLFSHTFILVPEG
jgi:hypothetical protein